MKKANVPNKLSLSRKEWLELLIQVLNEVHGLHVTYESTYEVAGLFGVLMTRGLIEASEGLKFRSLICEAIVLIAQRKLKKMRSRSRHGDVSKIGRGLRYTFQRYQFAPVLANIDLQELRELERRGYAARANSTLVSSRRALKAGKVHSNMFHSFDKHVESDIEKSGRPLHEFGFSSKEEFISFGARIALPHLRHAVKQHMLRKRSLYEADHIEKTRRKYMLSDEDIGLERVEFERLRERLKKRDAVYEASRGRMSDFERSDATKRLLELIPELRAGKPQRYNGCVPLLDELDRLALTPEDVGSSKEELRVLQQRRRQLYALHLAEWYRAGFKSPKEVFKELRELGVHPSLVGISADETELFTSDT
jgi:hypothetical protein